jgi:hypothetical protein
MAHFANIDDNSIVTSVIVVADSDASNEATGIAFCKALLGSDTNWVQTNKTGSIRYRYAGVGMKYDSTNDVFYGPQPFPSWTLSTSTWVWEAPVALPDDEGVDDVDDPTELVMYDWDEDTTSWVNRTVTDMSAR